MKNLGIAILLTLAATVTVSAQARGDKDIESSQIVERVVVRGNRRISQSEIKSWISTRKRSVYRPQALDRDVRALYDTGHFEDVKVYVENGIRGGKIVTFEFSERPLILDVSCEGIDSSQQAEVFEELNRQKVDVSNGSQYDAARTKRAARIIEELLSKKENRIVRASPFVERVTATDVLVTFKVASGSQR
jgi:outer membrane protein assembly factor BamA